jgi:hypothetical protein
MFSSRLIALTIIGLVHFLLLVKTVTGRAMVISSQEQAPTIIRFFIFLFLGYSVVHLGTRASLKDRTSALSDLRQLGLGPGLIFCIVFGAFILVGYFDRSGPDRWLPFLGRSPESDEAAVWLVSWFFMSSAAFALTSTRTAIAFTRSVKADGSQLIDVTQKPPYFTAKGLSEQREFVITQLAARASHLQKLSGYILLGIIFMLVCAALFIVFAGQITSLDVSGVKLVSLAQADVRSAEDELDRISSEITRTQANRRRAREQAAKGEPRSDVPSPEDTSSDDEISRLKYDAKKTALAKANDVLLRVKEKQFEDDRSKDQTSSQILLIQTSVTRFGVVLIMVFLVQILVSLYRYNMRLSAFYYGRADALVLVSKQPADLRALVELISPDKLDFGKPPRTPAEEAGGLLSAWSGRVRGRGDSQVKDDSDPKKIAKPEGRV